ncbi:MAG: TolC family protein [Bacteroidetes bacterium]|nr:TolC family protein [Bacteroidota bacterium]
MTKQFFLLLFILVAAQCRLALHCSAQQILDLGLDDARRHALEHNTSLANAGLSVDNARAQLREAVAQGLPQVSATVDYSNFFGSTVSLGNFPGMEIEFNPTSNLGISVSQIIFSGSYIVGVQSAKLYREMMETNREKTRNDILAQVTQAYCLCLISERMQGVVRDNLKNMQDMLDKSKALLDAGMSEELDHDQLTVQVSMLSDALRAADRQTELSRNMLRLHLGLTAEQEIRLTDDIETIVATTDFDGALAQPFSLEMHPEYRMMALQSDIAKRQLRMQQSSFLPTIAGFYNFTEKLLKPEFDITPKHVIGLNLSLPLFTSGARLSRIDQANVELRIAENQKKLLSQELQLREKQLRFNLNNAMEQYESQRANLRVSRKVHAGMKLKFEQGMISGLDLTTANNNFLQAENSYLTALLQLMEAQVEFARLRNSLAE